MRKLRSLTTRECAVRGAAVPPQAPQRVPLAPPCGVYCVCVGAVWWDFSPRSPTCVYEVNNPFILH